MGGRAPGAPPLDPPMDVYHPLQWSSPGQGWGDLPGGGLPGGMSAKGGVCQTPSHEQNHTQV